MDDFNKPKIIYPCIMSKSPSFMLDDNAKYYTVAPGNIITGKDLEYLIACLNSKIFYFASRKYYTGGGIEGELKTNRLLILPIPMPSSIKETHLEQLKKYCLEINGLICNPNYETSYRELLRKIDNILLEILNLTAKEYDYILNFEF